jgi:hypothetical protein
MEKQVAELLKFIQDKHQEYTTSSTEELKKHGHSKDELWFSAHMWAYESIVDKAKSLGLIEGKVETVKVLKSVVVEHDTL